MAPVDRLKDLKLSEWTQAHLPADMLEESKQKGRLRFRGHVQEFVRELKKQLPAGKNILFAHLMAGGVPRAKIIMPLMNRCVKGTGDRYLPSEEFWNSDMGQLCAHSFLEVTAETFRVLIEETAALRAEIEATGNFCAYSAYGYHGTEVRISDQLMWQTYTPYLQGWAKKALEDISREFSAKGVRSCVFNCPEILTNSSSIFQGVEIPLYPLLLSLEKVSPAKGAEVRRQCLALLKPEASFEQIMTICERTLKSSAVKARTNLALWPQHSERQQLETVLSASDELNNLHQNPKNLMTAILSEIVFQACGQLLLQISAAPESPVTWLNHDAVADVFARA